MVIKIKLFSPIFSFWDLFTTAKLISWTSRSVIIGSTSSSPFTSLPHEGNITTFSAHLNLNHTEANPSHHGLLSPWQHPNSKPDLQCMWQHVLFMLCLDQGTGLYLRRDWRKMHRYKSRAASWRRYSLGRHKKMIQLYWIYGLFPSLPWVMQMFFVCGCPERNWQFLVKEHLQPLSSKHQQLHPKILLTLRVRKRKWKLSHATDIPNQWVRGTPSHVISCYKKHTRMWG